jgi:hypothetical protein
MQTVALGVGEHVTTAYVLPLSVDGLIVVSSIAMVDDRAAGRTPRRSAKIAFAVGIIASVAANVTAADPTWLARVVAGWPAVALLLTVEVLSRSGRGRTQRAAPVSFDGRGRSALGAWSSMDMAQILAHGGLQGAALRLETHLREQLRGRQDLDAALCPATLESLLTHRTDDWCAVLETGRSREQLVVRVVRVSQRLVRVPLAEDPRRPQRVDEIGISVSLWGSHIGSGL